MISDKTAPPELPESQKLHRALHFFREYEQAVEQWMASGAVQTSKLTPGKMTFPPAPVEVGLAIGDCLQNLRAALDHEVYAQSVANRGATWGGLATCQFPFHAKDDAFRKNKQAQIGGLTPALQERIRSMQVFYQPESELARPLRLLHDMARLDRHRLLHVTAAQPTQLQLNPPIVAAPYIEATVTVRVFFVDRDFMQVDTQQNLEQHQRCWMGACADARTCRSIGRGAAAGRLPPISLCASFIHVPPRLYRVIFLAPTDHGYYRR